MLDMEWDTNYISSDTSITSNGESIQGDAHMPELPKPSMKHPEPGTRQPKADAPLNERLEYVLDVIHQSGFDSLESVVSQYYTSDFRPSPRLVSSQRLSRNRKLPAVLADLSSSATSWTEWEAQGYKGETVRSAESILAAERKKLVAPGTLQQLMEKYGKCDQPDKSKWEGLESASVIASFQREVESPLRNPEGYMLTRHAGTVPVDVSVLINNGEWVCRDTG